MDVKSMAYQDNIWDKELWLYDDLKEWNDDSNLVKEFIAKLVKAIEDKVIWIVSCMDDRLKVVDWTIRIAWSFVLLKDRLWWDEEYIAKMFKKLWVTKITTHDDCWAAWMHAKNNNLEWKADDITREEAMVFCKKYGFEHEHVLWIDNNPHAARSTIVDTTAKFNQAKFNWPESFVVTAVEEIPVQHVLDQVNVSINIATWSHWFGEKINSENPFFVFVLWDEWLNSELDNWLKMIQEERNWLVQIKYISIEK